MGFKWKRSQEGYLLIDHRAAPKVETFNGETEAIPAGCTWESATITCSHCHFIVILNPNRSRERNYCYNCDHYICDLCAEDLLKTTCLPFTKYLDQLQNEAEKNLILTKGL